MSFEGQVRDTFALADKGTVLLVDQLEGQPSIGDRLKCVDVHCCIAAFPDGGGWNPRTHDCLSRQELESPQWVFLIDIVLSKKQRRMIVGQQVIGISESST